MSTSSGPVTVRDSRSRTSEATGRSSPLASTNTSRRGSTSTSHPAPMSVQRSQSINIRELFNASNPENDFYVPEVFDAMDEGMELEEAFIQAQRAALAAINDAALAKAIQESEREAALPSHTQRSRSVEPSRLATAPKYALVSPSELGCPQDRNHARSGSGSSASTASGSGSGSTSASTAASSVLSSSLPKTAALNPTSPTCC
ncbi:hypothetical protein BKA70DRAFT_1423815 [Coprinopsis sp. MPI-PUGE-AT-0042]|nr:hypothetical protein BKA70DRAFT_1423815 [Coprinopsis sp. MPI-PUGE-AT-0042]